MKKNNKMFITDVVILLVCVMIFVIFKLSGFISIIVTIFVAVMFHTLLSYIFEKKEFIEEEEKQLSLKEQIQRIKREYTIFKRYINQLEEQIIDFERRQNALKKLIELNKGEKATYLLERSKEAEHFLLQKCNQFEKCLVVLQVLDNDDYEYQKNVEALEEILKTTRKMGDAYSELLSEVRRMGNGFNLDDPGITSAVEKLKAIRNETEEADKNGLFVVGSKKQDI